MDWYIVPSTTPEYSWLYTESNENKRFGENYFFLPTWLAQAALAGHLKIVEGATALGPDEPLRREAISF